MHNFFDAASRPCCHGPHTTCCWGVPQAQLGPWLQTSCRLGFAHAVQARQAVLMSAVQSQGEGSGQSVCATALFDGRCQSLGIHRIHC